MGVTKLGRKPLPEEERKDKISIRLPKKIIAKLRETENYNALIEKLVINYFKDEK